MTHKEADHRLAAGWHIDLEEADALCSAQRKRYLRQEMERLGRSAGYPADLTAFGGTPNVIDVFQPQGHP